MAEESFAMAAAALLTATSPFSDSGAETEVKGVLAPVVVVEPLPEAEALAACVLQCEHTTNGQSQL